MERNMKRSIEVYNSLNEMYEIHGKINLTSRELAEKGLSSILIKSEGFITFTILVEKAQAIDVINEDYSTLIQEHIKGFEGIYGYFGASKALVNHLKNPENPEKFVIYLDYKGPYWSINSGLREGGVIITGNFRGVKFKNIMM